MSTADPGPDRFVTAARERFDAHNKQVRCPQGHEFCNAVWCWYLAGGRDMAKWALVGNAWLAFQILFSEDERSNT